MTPVELADRLLDALEKAGLITLAYGWEQRMRAVLVRELESVLRKEELDGPVASLARND